MYTIAGVLIVLWLLGLLMSIGGAWIHLLLVVAAVMLLVKLMGKKDDGMTGGGMKMSEDGGQPVS